MVVTRRDVMKMVLAAMPGIALAAPHERMPVLFVGHGSPMNAIRESSYSRALQALGARLPRPSAILVVSAHWLTRGTRVLLSERPATIHDFSGFPEPLQTMTYPAPGATEVSRRAYALLGPQAQLASDWGLDHGTWTVLHRLYPKADIPVMQLSLDSWATAEAHYGLGAQLAPLRDTGVLIVGSGNIVHNLRATEQRTDDPLASQGWAQQFDDAVRMALSRRDDERLVRYPALPGSSMAVPTPEHYWPLLYALGASAGGRAPTTVYEGFQSGTISMRTLLFG